MSASRPVTSKTRGVCKYYNSPTGCLAGRMCKFSHGDEKWTPFDKGKTCKFYAAGFCKRDDKCWFVHALPETPRVTPDEEKEEHTCSICLEKPTTYGLMGGCSHVFCVKCIREWRHPSGKSEDVVSSGVTKTCPLCRAPSQFVIPSSHFYPQNHPSKVVALAKYKESMTRIPCKYFQQSSPQKRFCPFGKDCFYQHLNPDGTPYVFKDGVKELIKKRQYQALRRELEMGASNAYTRPSAFALDAVIAGLRELAISVSQAAARASDDMHTGDGAFAEPREHEPWIEGGDAETDTVISTLADTIISSLTALTREPPFTSGQDSDITSTEQATSHTFNNTLLRSDNILPNDPDSSSSSSPLTVPPIQSSPLSTSPVIVSTTQRLLEALPPRFSTSHSPRASLSLHSDAGLENFAHHTADHSIHHSQADNVAYPIVADEASSLTAPGLTVASPSPAPPSPPILASQDLVCVASAAAPVQDIDPPFMTDGRGRVVWSSATAGSRSRRSRTAMAPGAGPATLHNRDKPRDIQTMETSQTQSPLV